MFGDYDKLVNHYARACYDGDSNKSYMVEQSNRINKRASEHQANSNLKTLNFDLHIGCHSHMDLGWLNTYTGYQDRKIFYMHRLIS